MMTALGSNDLARLSALIARQRRELDGVQALAAARSVIDLARGMLMAQLGCSPAEAEAQLAQLADDARTSAADLAAQITGQLPVPAPVPGHDRLSPPAAVSQAAPDGQGIAAAMLDEALAPVGAAAVAIWLTEPDGSLALTGEAGFGAREASRWRHIHPDMDVLPQRAAHGTEVWWPGGPPENDSVPLIGRWPGGGRAALPLRDSGVAVGAMVVCWPEALASIPAETRRHVLAMAEFAAQALGASLPRDGRPATGQGSWIYGLIDSLFDSAIVAHAIRDADGQVTDFRVSYVSTGFLDPAGRESADVAGRSLLELYPAAALAGGLFDRAAAVLATGEPQSVADQILSADLRSLGAAQVVDTRVAPLFDGVVITWRRADEGERVAALLQQAQRLGQIGGWEEDLLTGGVHWTKQTFDLFGQDYGNPIPMARLHTRVAPDDVRAVDAFRDTLLRDVEQAAAAFRVIRADDESMRQMRAFAEPVTDQAGTLIAVRGAYQDVSAYYHAQVAFAAASELLADTEERAAEEHRLALRLQQAITPQSSEPVEAPGLDVVARYRPAGPGHLVSGDWYDTVLLPSSEVLLVVGDVAGHGIDAVTGMVALRNCLRGLAITGAGPAVLLGWLNSVACHLTDGIVATAVCGLYDPASRVLRWARAGHFPPVLVRAGQARQLDGPSGLLLGVDPEASYAEASTPLQLGDALLLFTDGLIELRDKSIDEVLDALLRIAAEPVTDISSYADRLVELATSDTDDDACLVAVRIR